MSPGYTLKATIFEREPDEQLCNGENSKLMALGVNGPPDQKGLL